MEKKRTSHKWTSDETNLFCEIALKRHSAVKYLMPLLLNLKKIFSSKKKNQKTSKQKKKETKLLVEVEVFS